MINIAITVIFALGGLFGGYGMQKVADFLTARKIAQKNIEEQNKLFGNLYVKLALCILSSFVWGIAAWFTGSALTAFLLSLLYSLAVMISIIDLRIYIIPNELVIAVLVLGALFQLEYFGFKSFLIALACMIGITVIFLAAAAILGFNKVGAGDVKLAGAMGLVLGYPHILTAVLAMCAVMSVYILFGITTYKLNLRSMFAYGPFMMLGMIVALVNIVVNIPIF